MKLLLFNALKILILSMGFVQTVIAVPTKPWVYKVSLDDPRVVFKDGMKTADRGTFESFYDHLTGSACVIDGFSSPRTGFISLTGNRAVAIAVAQQLAASYPDTSIYVYRIRGDLTVYQSLETARYMYQRNPVLGPIPDDLVSTLNNEDEYITARSIPTGQIYEANVVRPGHMDDGQVVVNDRYGWGISTETNPQPYTGAGTDLTIRPPTETRTYFWNRALRTVTGCFQNMMCPRNRIYMGDGAAADITAIKRYSIPIDEFFLI